MTKLELMLKRYPNLGLGASAGSGLMSYIDALDPVLRFGALLVGLLIGIVTLLVKMEEYRAKKLERIEIEGEFELRDMEMEHKKFKLRAEAKGEIEDEESTSK